MSARVVRGLGAVLALAAYLVLPLRLDDFWLSALTFAGIGAIGATGLNLLTGYCGQVSLAHGFFLGLGAYAGAWAAGLVGSDLLAWLPAAAVAGAVVGAAAGPFALRLSGNLLVVVSLALVFGGQHLFRNWTALTGGSAGRGDLPLAHLGPLDFSALEVAGRSFSFDQGYFWLVWALVAGVTVLALRLVRGRPGRAMAAVRHDDLAAAAIGIDVARVKVAAFALSGALGAAAGALYGSYRQFVGPEEWDLFLSIEYLAMVIVGGLGTVAGPILGAVFLGVVPRLVEEWAAVIPLVDTAPGARITTGQLNRFLFGAVIIAFLLAEPRGLDALVAKIGRRIRSLNRRRRRMDHPGAAAPEQRVTARGPEQS